MGLPRRDDVRQAGWHGRVKAELIQGLPRDAPRRIGAAGQAARGADAGAIAQRGVSEPYRTAFWRGDQAPLARSARSGWICVARAGFARHARPTSWTRAVEVRLNVPRGT